MILTALALVALQGPRDGADLVGSLKVLPDLRAPKAGARLPKFRRAIRFAWLPAYGGPDFGPEGVAALASGLLKPKGPTAPYTTIPEKTFLSALDLTGAKKTSFGTYDMVSATPAAEKVGADHYGLVQLESSATGSDAKSNWITVRGVLTTVSVKPKGFTFLLEKVEVKHSVLKTAANPNPTVVQAAYRLGSEAIPARIAGKFKELAP